MVVGDCNVMVCTEVIRQTKTEKRKIINFSNVLVEKDGWTMIIHYEVHNEVLETNVLAL